MGSYGGGGGAVGVSEVATVLGKLGVQLRQGEVLAVIRFCSWSDAAQEISVEQLREYLCNLCSFRQLQKRLQVRIDEGRAGRDRTVQL